MRISRSVNVRESYFWTQVKAGLEDELTHLTRVENDSGVGISDVTACRGGIEVWLELKVFHHNQLHFRTSQSIWINRRSDVGGKIWVVARRDDTMYVWPAVELLKLPRHLIKGREGKAFYLKFDELPPPTYWCNKPFSWRKVGDVLFGTLQTRSAPETP